MALFRLMETPLLWYEAYANIYANKGAITPGADATTLDGFSEKRVTASPPDLCAQSQLEQALNALDEITARADKLDAQHEAVLKVLA